MSDKLKPCPFCGSNEIVYDNCDLGSGKWYYCLGCGVQVKVSYKEDLEKKWNRRADNALALKIYEKIKDRIPPKAGCNGCIFCIYEDTYCVLFQEATHIYEKCDGCIKLFGGAK